MTEFRSDFHVSDTFVLSKSTFFIQLQFLYGAEIVIKQILKMIENIMVIVS